MFHENSPVQSVAKALRLPGLLMEAHQPLTLAALSEQTGWPKRARSTACAHPPRPCATPSALSACSTVCVRRISSAILT